MKPGATRTCRACSTAGRLGSKRRISLFICRKSCHFCVIVLLYVLVIEYFRVQVEVDPFSTLYLA